MELIKKTNFTELNKEVQLNKKPRVIGLVINGVHYTHTFHVEIFKNNDKLFSKGFSELDKAETRFKTECNKLKKEVKQLEQKSLEAIYILNYSSMIRRVLQLTNIKIEPLLLASKNRHDAIYDGVKILKMVKGIAKPSDLLTAYINDIEKELLKFSREVNLEKTKYIIKTTKPRCAERAIKDTCTNGIDIFNYAYINKLFNYDNTFEYRIKVHTFYQLGTEVNGYTFDINTIPTDDELNAKFKELCKENYKKWNIEGVV